MTRMRNELRCDDCEACVEQEDSIPCGCGLSLCESCYDSIHQGHGLPPERLDSYGL